MALQTPATPQPLQSVVMPLRSLQPNRGQIDGVPKNPRDITKADYNLLKQSIIDNPEMLSLRELLVYLYNEKYVIIGGNMRYEALKELGYKDTVCKIVPPETTAEQLKAYVLKDNSAFGSWNYEDLANEWDAALLAACNIELPELDVTASTEDEAEEDNADLDELLPEEPSSKTGDIYLLGNHRLICGDSTDPTVFAALMDGKCANLCVTDPPYNVNYEDIVKFYGKNGMKNTKRKTSEIANDNLSPEEYRRFLNAVFANVSDVLHKGGGCYIFHASKEVIANIEAMVNNGISFKQQLIWVKNHFVLGRQDYQWAHEPLLYGWKDGGTHYFINKRDERTVIEDLPDFDAMTKAELVSFLKELYDQDSNPTSIIREDMPLHSDLHPTMKPLKLIGRLIRNSSRKGDLVLDPFGGSGSTLMAAEQLGRTCYMVEYSPIYCDAILKRYENLTGNKPKLLGNIGKTTEKLAKDTQTAKEI